MVSAGLSVCAGLSGLSAVGVSGVLSEPGFLVRLGVPFEGSGYAIAGVRVEKVLVGKASEFSSSENSKNLRVPFDAQVWIHLSRR